MPEPLLGALRRLELHVPDPARSAAFYEEVWGLERAAGDGGTIDLRAAGTEPAILRLRRSAQPAVGAATFDAADPEALRDRLARAGIAVDTPPRALDAPGGGIGFAFDDPEGRPIAIAADVAPAPARPAGSRPLKLAHVVYNAVDADAMTSFYRDVLGLRLSDRTRMMAFLRTGRDHHAIAFAGAGAASFNHVAFEMESWDALMYACGRLRAAGRRVLWGVGRHGPGANVFAYFLDPDGIAIEYTAEVQQIDEATHRPGGPADWARPGGNLDRWELAEPPASELAAAMHHGPALLTSAAAR